MEVPDLSIVMPGVKNALTGADVAELIPFPLDVGSTAVSISGVSGINDTRYFDGVLSDEECAVLVANISASRHLSFWNSDDSKRQSAQLFRDADTIEIEAPEFAEYLWKKILPVIDFKEISIDKEEDDPRWERELVGTWQPCGLNSDMLFARYLPGGHFAPHTDGRAIKDFNCRSFYSVVFFLNTIPVGSGGGTRFYKNAAVEDLRADGGQEGNKWTGRPELVTGLVDPVAGRLLAFEQSLVHEGVPPTGEYCKYIIRSDVMYARTPPVCDQPQDVEAYRLFTMAEQLAEGGNVAASIPLFRKAVKLSPDMAAIMGH